MNTTPRTRVRRVALTGGIATGKSYVRRRLQAAGVPTIDADVLAREAVAPGTAGLQAVVARFGEGVLTAGGQLDRRALAAIVFSDAEARRSLEAIIHPAVRRAGDDWFGSIEPAVHPFAVADIPLLYETGRDRAFDRVVVVACGPDLQLERLMARDGLSDAEARARIAAQLPIGEKIRRAHHVIRTDATFEETDRQVDELLAWLRHW